jgi:nucleoside-diphosphate-sugar epimerase
MAILENFAIPATGWSCNIFARDYKIVFQNVRKMINASTDTVIDYRKLYSCIEKLPYWNVHSKAVVDEVDDKISITGIFKLMESNYTQPINIGSSRLLSINDLAELIATIAGKTIAPIHINGPVGVQGRCSDNRLIKQVLSWEPEDNLEHGLSVTYKWIKNELKHA